MNSISIVLVLLLVDQLHVLKFIGMIGGRCYGKKIHSIQYIVLVCTSLSSHAKN